MTVSTGSCQIVGTSTQRVIALPPPPLRLSPPPPPSSATLAGAAAAAAGAAAVAVGGWAWCLGHHAGGPAPLSIGYSCAQVSLPRSLAAAGSPSCINRPLAKTLIRRQGLNSHVHLLGPGQWGMRPLHKGGSSIMHQVTLRWRWGAGEVAIMLLLLLLHVALAGHPAHEPYPNTCWWWPPIYRPIKDPPWRKAKQCKVSKPLPLPPTSPFSSPSSCRHMQARWEVRTQMVMAKAVTDVLHGWWMRMGDYRRSGWWCCCPWRWWWW